REPGWILDIEPAFVDALRFQTLTVRARARRERGEAHAAAGDLAAALRLWRGAALVDVVDAGYLAAQANSLEEARLDAIEDLAEAELDTGRAAEALARLEPHVDANRLRERGWGLLMMALYRLGRQAAALRAFQQVRGILGEELGLEPSPELAEIERRILRHDPTLGNLRPHGPGDAGAATAPRAGACSPGARAPAPPPAPAPAPAPSASAASTPGNEFADYSVVVVEDHDFQRRTVVQLLRGLGVGNVTDAANGTEALRVVEAGPSPDVIICDIDMPSMDGVEFVGRIAERNLACALVIASGLETNVLRAVESIGESHGLHVLAALQKPLTARRLGEVLRQYARLNNERGEQLGELVADSDELQNALESGELRPLFEPRIDLTTGALSSAEAGGRWRSPDGSPVPASAFIPALGREALRVAFVERLVAESCELAAEAARAGLDANAPIRLALNLPLLPSDASFADRLTEMVQTCGQDPRRFLFQLDDIALARSPAPALSVLTRLRVKGFGLSMSYSGVGPSWTNQLERVPLSELKLGRRLASGASDDAKRLAVLESALASARDQGLSVVVDGCDSRADFETLLALGCSEAQGRFVGEPMSAGDLVAWSMSGDPLAAGAGS
ncbi:MAG: EAL domain-containing protein, partial [Actinomycetota bacterium]|nr:EAL domain-containing protein [Actinomycetota bacterium]